MAIQVPEDARLDIIVNGAGLSGIASAITFALHGHRVTVLESAKELAEVGQEHPLQKLCRSLFSRS
jgi:salicylate hydroxylase